MSFTDLQIRKLKSKLKPQYVRMRETEGQTLHYLEGWHVIAEANRIFGFDAWDRETLSNTCVWTKQVGARYCAAYVARVRITVRAGDVTVTREGCGSGESNEPTPGQAHDRAAKAAETDATKRALTTFGNCFGLTLHAGVPPHPDQRSSGRHVAPSAGNSSGHAPNGHGAQNYTNYGEAVAPGETISSDAEHAAGFLGLNTSDDEKMMEAEDYSRQTRGRVDKGALAIAEPRRIRDPAHLKYVAEQPCMICGRQPCQAHHLRYVQPRALGRKSSDSYTVPLCAIHHRELHTQGNERAWWAGLGRDPLPVADDLWRHSRGDQSRI